MHGHLPIARIAEQLNQAALELAGYCNSLSDEQFFFQPENKWSPAQQVKHLVTATATARLAFILPPFIVRLVGGRPNRPSRTYDELAAKYQLKLSRGGKASGRYIPKPVPVYYGKNRLLEEFTGAMEKFVRAVQKIKQEHTPDAYIVPHPLLGKITLRELGYFTIFHTRHHLHSIQALTQPSAPAVAG